MVLEISYNTNEIIFICLFSVILLITLLFVILYPNYNKVKKKTDLIMKNL